jgi:hypothetical protein
VRQLSARRRADLPRDTNAATRAATSSRGGRRGCGWQPRPQRCALQPLREVRSWLAPAQAHYLRLALGNQTGRHKPGHGGRASGLSGKRWLSSLSPYKSGAHGTPRAPARPAARPQIHQKLRSARRPKTALSGPVRERGGGCRNNLGRCIDTRCVRSGCRRSRGQASRQSPKSPTQSSARVDLSAP